MIKQTKNNTKNKIIANCIPRKVADIKEIVAIDSKIIVSLFKFFPQITHLTLMTAL